MADYLRVIAVMLKIGDRMFYKGSDVVIKGIAYATPEAGKISLTLEGVEDPVVVSGRQKVAVVRS